MDSELVQKMIFSVLGGLGIFLLGMRYMSDGLQIIAGPSLRRMIGTVTDNRLLACVTGVIVTCLVQSSSVTTVMTVGLVNSGVMALNQAIGVILGANIGTTITGWVLALKIGKYGLPILGVAGFVFLFSKNEKWKYIGMAIMGIGMVFYGLEIMKNGVKVIKQIDAFHEAFTYFDAQTYFGVLKCALIGCILTVLVQSSSATLGITIALASQGVIDFESAAALVLGENIGTTITAWLASIGSGENAKRAAYFHIIFNIIGVIWITSIFRLYIPFIENVCEWFFNIDDIRQVSINADGEKEYLNGTKAIACVHTIFNVVNVLIFLPFTAFFGQLLTKYVKVGSTSGKDRFTRLPINHGDTPMASLEMVTHEIHIMCETTKGMFPMLEDVIKNPEDHKKFVKELFKKEEEMDHYQKEITEFLTQLLSEARSQDDVELAKHQLRVADEYESVSDYMIDIIKLCLRLKDDQKYFDKELIEGIISMHSLVEKYFIELSEYDDHILLTEEQFVKLEGTSESVTSHFRSLRSDHWDRLANTKINPLVITSYSDVLQSYRKIKNHLLNIVEVQAGHK
jgi:phosphate:Na+ symporter